MNVADITNDENELAAKLLLSLVYHVSAFSPILAGGRGQRYLNHTYSGSEVAFGVFSH